MLPPTSVRMWYKELFFQANSCPISSNSQRPETIRCIEMKYIFNKIHVYDMPYKRSPQQRLRQNLTKIHIYRHLSAVAYIRVISKTPKSSKLSKIFKTQYFSTFPDISWFFSTHRKPMKNVEVGGRPNDHWMEKENLPWRMCVSFPLLIRLCLHSRFLPFLRGKTKTGCVNVKLF